MARPKLPAAQRKVLTMAVRMRQDLDEGLAAVALLRGTTKSGLVSQYSAEQTRLEREHDQPCFDAAVKEIKRRRRAKRAKRAARQRFKSPSDSSATARVKIGQRRLARVEHTKASPHNGSIGLCLTTLRRLFRLVVAFRPSPHGERKPLVTVQKLTQTTSV